MRNGIRKTGESRDPEHLTFIEPQPDRLNGLLSNSDRGLVDIRPYELQRVTDAPWCDLDSGDILFIDSSHVCKCGSDVHFLFTEVMPALRDGVLIHIHDISFPFEYPRSWLTERHWVWNEAYIVQAFLQFNSRYEITSWVPYLNLVFEDFISEQMPLCRNDFGGSLWIRKVKAA